MQLFRTLAVIALVLLVLPWDAYASIKAPPVTGTQELAVRQTFDVPSRMAQRVKVALTAAPGGVPWVTARHALSSRTPAACRCRILWPRSCTERPLH